MLPRLTPLALALSASLLTPTTALATAGVNGAHGSITGPQSPNGTSGQPFTNASTITRTDLNTGSASPSDGTDGTSVDAGGGGGTGGAGAGSVFGALSQGNPNTNSSGGVGGLIANKIIDLTGSTELTLTGGQAGHGGTATNGGGGLGGAGGGSVFGALSQGSAAGYFSSPVTYYPTAFANGGSARAISDIQVTLSQLKLEGSNGNGGNGGNTTVGAGGNGGAGGGSVFGGLSQGGAAGLLQSYPTSGEASSRGGNGVSITNITLNLTNIVLNGGKGGNAGSGSTAGGNGGAGGGSLFGGLSQGGGAGYSGSDATISLTDNGGAGGGVTQVEINLTNATLNGGAGGNGGSAGGNGAGGNGGAGGGSIFGGFSQGGAGGFNYPPSTVPTIQTNGGAGGAVGLNQIILSNITLIGEAGGTGGSGGTNGGGGDGATGIDGGSIFGGFSAGGAGGFAQANDVTTPISADGGAGGSASNNHIKLAGNSALTGSIYGGYSQGGNHGHFKLGTNTTVGQSGLGGEAINNTITLVGTGLTISGAIYGGFSINGDVNFASAGYAGLNNSKTFSGNSLELNGYKGSVTGVYNIERFSWGLTPEIVNGDTLIKITGSDPVQLDNTFHTVTTLYDGQQFNSGDTFILIDKAQGTPTQTNVDIQDGYFLLYNTEIAVVNDQLVLKVIGTAPQSGGNNGGSNGGSNGGNAGQANPDSKTFVEGHASSAAITQRGADLITEYGIYSAVASARPGKWSGFAVSGGGSNRYNTGSHVDVRDVNVALGVAKGIELTDESLLTLGVFMEYGQSHYDTYNRSRTNSKIHGKGNAHYNGGGLLVHYNVDATNTDSYTDKGLYLFSALRAGNTKNNFKSQYFVNDQGIAAEYDAKSPYYSALLGAGYALALDEQQVIDLYSRYTWATNRSDTVQVDNQPLKLDTVDSSRLRVGARYNYVFNEHVTPYAGIGYEREFEGRASASAKGVTLDQPSLKGNTGIVELGISAEPSGVLEDWFINAGVQGYWGKREGVSGILKLGYSF